MDAVTLMVGALTVVVQLMLHDEPTDEDPPTVDVPGTIQVVVMVVPVKHDSTGPVHDVSTSEDDTCETL